MENKTNLVSVFTSALMMAIVTGLVLASLPVLFAWVCAGRDNVAMHMYLNGAFQTFIASVICGTPILALLRVVRIKF